MAMEPKIDTTFRLADIITFGSIIVTAVAFFATLHKDVVRNRSDIDSMMQWHKNVGDILTAHTTQVAVNARDISSNREMIKSNREFFDRIGGKIDEMKVLVVRHHATPH
jgi:hypothetical protein